MSVTKRSLMTIKEVKHFKDGKCIWENYDIPNLWHSEGQEFMLAIAFSRNHGLSVPNNYYLGLDNRSAITEGQTLADLVNEPTGNGYIRQGLSSTSSFSVGVNESNEIVAVSGIITFVATISPGWGPIRNAFLTTSADSSGKLISTAHIGGMQSLSEGSSLSFRINLSLT